jgi:hypothetical protein
MKNRYTLLAAIVILTARSASAQSYGELDLSDVRARFYAHGLIGVDLATQQSAFEVPIGSGMHPMYSAGLWMGGISVDNQTHLAAMMYEGAGESDYYPGPLTTDGSASTDADMMAQFDHVWIITREEIGRHLAYFACLADPDCDELVEFPDGYITPPSFFDWPAINTVPGYETYLAPFMDTNNDGDYQPTDGDAPCIMGDQAAFFVFNDKGGPHFFSGGIPIGVEVQAMPFVFDGDSPALDQTVFMHYRIINRGTLTLNDAHIGFFMDPDLGCSEDDLIGSDPARNLIYALNGDDNDEDCMGMTGYGTQPPAFGVALLRGPHMDSNGMDDPLENTMPAWNGRRFGNSVFDDERLGLSRAMYFLRDGNPAMTAPQSGGDFMNYLHGRWKDGTPLTYGGNGYGGVTAARFAFPDGTDPLGVGVGGSPQPAWSETSAGNTPADRRTLSSMGPITLEPGMHQDLFLALVYARATAGGPSASVQALQARVDSVRTFLYNNSYWGVIDFDNLFDQSPICMTNYSVQVGEHEIVSLQLYPNPASTSFTLQASMDMGGQLLLLRDLTGRIVAKHRLSQGLNGIDIASIACGVYTCEVRSGKARYTGRLVKD